MAHASTTGGFKVRSAQALALLVVVGMVYGAIHASPRLEAELGPIAALGFLLLAGTLLSELLEPLGLPHLSGYLLAGVVGGPHVLHLVDHGTVEALSPVNTLALALIALAGGLELRVSTLRSVARGVSVALGLHSLVGIPVLGGAFMLLAPLTPFGKDLGGMELLGVGMLWGVIGISRSPSACLAILAQTRAAGPIATFSLAFIMASDVVVLLMMALAMMLARPLITGSEGLSFDDFAVLGHEVVGSIALGTTLGLILILYLKFTSKHLLLVLLALGFAFTEFLRYVHIDPLLAFLTAGFVVQNLSVEGPKLLHGIEHMSAVVFVVFFATAGAHLDLPLLGQLWPVAVALCATRALVSVLTSRWSSTVAKDPPAVKRWGFSSLISQAGLTLGLSVVVARTFPEVGTSFRSLVIATVAINEVVGPILFKFALDRAGESGAQPTSIRPPAPE